MRATLTGAIWQMFGTAFALWIPCLPIFFLMRNALNSKAGNKCAPSPADLAQQRPQHDQRDHFGLHAGHPCTAKQRTLSRSPYIVAAAVGSIPTRPLPSVGSHPDYQPR